MKLTKIRTTLAAFITVGVIAAAGAIGVASAAGADTVQTATLELSAQIAHLSTTGTRLPVVEGYTIVGVTAGSTGDGPADEKECDARAGVINGFLDQAYKLLLADKSDDAGYWVKEADRAENEALDRGCFIIE